MCPPRPPLPSSRTSGLRAEDERAAGGLVPAAAAEGGADRADGAEAPGEGGRGAGAAEEAAQVPVGAAAPRRLRGGQLAGGPAHAAGSRGVRGAGGADGDAEVLKDAQVS